MRRNLTVQQHDEEQKNYSHLKRTSNSAFVHRHSILPTCISCECAKNKEKSVTTSSSRTFIELLLFVKKNKFKKMMDKKIDAVINWRKKKEISI